MTFSLLKLPKDAIHEVLFNLENHQEALYSINATCKELYDMIQNSNLRIQLIYDRFRSHPHFKVGYHEKTHSLCAKTQSERSLYHLLNNPSILPYIKHLFIHEARGSQIYDLCSSLNVKEKNINSPSKYVYLHECTLDKETIQKLESLKEKYNIHISNTGVTDEEPKEDSKLLDFDDFLKEDSDQVTLTQLQDNLNLEYSYSIIYDTIANLSFYAKDEIIFSIWSSSLSMTTSYELPPRKIESKTWDYLSKDCAQNALQTAISSFLKQGKT